MANKDEDEFEEQLRQEDLARLAKEEGAALSRGASFIDEDGTVMEWDPERKAYFAKIDADFIAQYQINYGVGQDNDQTLTEEQKKAQHEEYWQNYYNVYAQEQPKLPKFDEEGNPIEEDDEETENKNGESEGKPQIAEKTAKTEGSDTKDTQGDSSSSQWDSDPTSDEHYQYNLYYYGKEYADAYRDYYEEHPEGEPMPDWINQKEKQEEETKTAEGKKGKKQKPDKAVKRTEPPQEEGWFEMGTETSVQVYVSGLPLDITDEEYNEIMSKCGLIMFDPLTHLPKLKLYRDGEGNLKGDGLCSYIKPESVTLALQILDGTEIRGHTVSVQRAKFEMKGSFDPKKKRKKLSNKAKQKLKERQQKLFDWRPDKNPFERAKHERVVILKNMFDIKEFENNPALINELRVDVREECTKFGDVRKVTLYDRNPEGVIAVMYSQPEEADACIASLNGRWFAKNRVVALTFDGKTKYDVQETEEERAKRLKGWEDFLKGEEMDATKRESSSLKEKGGHAIEMKEKGGSRTTEVKEKGGGRTTEVKEKGGSRTTEVKEKDGGQTIEMEEKGGSRTTEVKEKGGGQTIEMEEEGGQTIEMEQKGGSQTTEMEDKGGGQTVEMEEKGGGQTIEIKEKEAASS